MKALILVDIQNDFVKGGALAIDNGEEVIEVANRLMQAYDFVVATQDSHPADHLSFASQHEGRAVGDVIDLAGLQQVLWPDHCIQGSRGAEFCATLDRSGIHDIVRKGTDRNIDSYSGFFDNGHRKATGLEALLREKGAKEIHVMGLATDYCVKFTALDARQLGFDTRLILEGVRGVNLNAGDCDKAIQEMKESGVRLVGGDGP